MHGVRRRANTEQPPETVTRGPPHIVMPANAGIHAFFKLRAAKIVDTGAFAGMTQMEGRYVNDWGG